MEWVSFGARDVVMLLIAVAAVYLVVILLKLARLGRRASTLASGQEPLLAASPPIAAPAAVDTPAPRGGFGEHLADHLARADVEMEVQRMRDEMERMRREMEELRAARRVSPQYAEAMELAQRGLSAQDVADQLGISLAEAELVHALSRGRQEFDDGDEHGADRYAPGFDEFDRSSR